MSKKTDEEKFMDDLYNDANEELKKVYKEQKDSRNNILKEIAQVILSYNVLDLFMNINNSSKKKLHNKFTNLIVSGIKSVAKKEIGVLNNVLESTVKKTFKFYSYNSNLKDVRKIIDSNFKEKKFSERVWDNQEEVAKRLEFQIKRFLDGKINVNQIKRDIEKTFNANAYNSKRLVETEVARASSKAFDRFCKETGVKKVKYNATLDSNICQHCSNDHGKVFNLKDKIETPRHPLCRCFYTIEDDDYEIKSKVDDEIAVSKDDDNDIINNEDIEEYNKFKDALGKEAPKTFKDFQEIKYNNINKYKDLEIKYKDFEIKNLLKKHDIELVDKISDKLYSVKNYNPDIKGMTQHAKDNLQNKSDRSSMTTEKAKEFIDNAKLVIFDSHNNTIKFIAQYGYAVLNFDNILVTAVPQKWRNKYNKYLKEE